VIHLPLGIRENALNALTVEAADEDAEAISVITVIPVLIRKRSVMSSKEGRTCGESDDQRKQ
jgi:hypothetical protein